MNILLFTEQELSEGVNPEDKRVKHVRQVLSIADGRKFDAGVIDGMRGKAKFKKTSDEKLAIEFEATHPPSDLYPLDVVIGLSRPQTCRFVLRSLASLGVRSIEFVLTESGERSYASSQLWTTSEYNDILITAVSQAFETKLPKVRFDRTLSDAVCDPKYTQPTCAKICLDNYEATMSLAMAVGAEFSAPPNHLGLEQSTGGSRRARQSAHATGLSGPSEPGVSSLETYSQVSLLIGSERGWTDSERDLLRDYQYVLASLGARVLRVETATVAAVSTVLAQRFWPNETGTLSTREG